MLKFEDYWMLLLGLVVDMEVTSRMCMSVRRRYLIVLKLISCPFKFFLLFLYQIPEKINSNLKGK